MGDSSKKSFAVLGLGKFGASVAVELARSGAQVLAVDNNSENVQAIADEVTYAVQADVCDIKAMEALGLSNMDGVIIAITGNLDASVMATILAKETGAPFVLAKAKEELHERILKKTGADKVIIPERESGLRVAHNLLSGNFLEFVELSHKLRLIEITVKPEWVGKSLKSLQLRRKMQMNIIAMKGKDDVDASADVDPDKPLEEGMSLWVVLDKKQIDRLL